MSVDWDAGSFKCVWAPSKIQANPDPKGKGRLSQIHHAQPVIKSAVVNRIQMYMIDRRLIRQSSKISSVFLNIVRLSSKEEGRRIHGVIVCHLFNKL